MFTKAILHMQYFHPDEPPERHWAHVDGLASIVELSEAQCAEIERVISAPAGLIVGTVQALGKRAICVDRTALPLSDMQLEQIDSIIEPSRARVSHGPS